MTRSFGRRAGALVGLLLGGMALVATSAGPASAQVTQYRFQADCTRSTTANFVDVPAGTVGAGIPPAGGIVTTQNLNVTFPSGATAVVNETSTVNGVITRQAVHFLTGPNAGVIVGQVICTPTTSSASALVGSSIAVSCPAAGGQLLASGVATIANVTVGNPAGARCTVVPGATSSAAADGLYSVNPYPLAVDGASAAATPALATPASKSDSGGSNTNLLLLGGAGALGLAVLGQVTIGRRMRRQGDATS